MLFEPERHAPLHAVPWDETRARMTITAIAADAAARFVPEPLAPIHPLDHTDLTPVTSYKSLYIGAAGVLWTLHYLAADRVIAPTHDWVPALERVHQAYLDAPETVMVMPSYLLGEAGILLVLWRMRRTNEIADRLHSIIGENATHPANEFMLGAPGTMLAALWLHEWSGEERWRTLFVECAKQLWSEWKYEPAHQCWLWTQQLFGESGMHLGAVHGFTGNTYPLLRGARFLTAERRAELYRRCAETLERTALTDDTGANWPQSVGQHREGRSSLLVQWCHGSPGIVGTMRYLPTENPRLEALLVQGGELIWKAGPLIKGPGLCHGTAGNGYALLELYRRTGDATWLTRARAFAMHAIGQYEAMREQYGHGRYSLWTGDAGVAVYLWHCIQGEGGFPGMDVL